MNSLNDVSLNYFTGTDKYYRHRIGTSQLLLTEGCKYVAEQGKAYWLFDIILSYQNHDKIKTQEFQVWTLKKNKQKAFSIRCDDGNGNILVTQNIDYSDFPLNSISIYVVDEVCMLKSEY